jgi:signal transduction histidine kinase
VGKRASSQESYLADWIVTFGFVIAFLFLTVSAFVSFFNARTAIEDIERVSMSHLALAEFESVFSAITDAESSQRGYIITGNETFLRPFESEVDQVWAGMDRGTTMVHLSQEQLQRIVRLKQVTAAKIDRMRLTIEIRRDEGFAAAMQVVAEGEGKRQMDEIRSLINNLKTEERRLLDQRQERAESSTTRAIYAFWASSIAGLALLVVLFVLTIRHLSLQRKHAQEQSRHAGELEHKVALRTSELEAVNQELESFSYSVSHDLRAPLRAVAGNAAILQEDLGERLTEDEGVSLERIQSNVQKMSRLIDDLLRLSRATRGEMRLEPLDVTAIAKVIADEVAGRYDHNVEVQVQEGMKADGDSRLVAILLENLLENAFKFTAQADMPRVLVFQRNGHFGVSDNGAGFEQEYADKMFEPFQRLHADKDFPGTGIGLTICKRIVSRHGGKIWAEGSPSGGATIRFTLSP